MDVGIQFKEEIKMRINHNIAALNTQRQLTIANNGQAKSMEKLSSGLRINRAGDDAAVEVRRSRLEPEHLRG